MTVTVDRAALRRAVEIWPETSPAADADPLWDDLSSFVLEICGASDVDSEWDRLRPFIHLLGVLRSEPFLTLDQLRDRIGSTTVGLRQMVEAVRVSQPARRLVIDGPSQRYWRNTILPMEQAGVFDAIVEGRSRFPYRVGLFPGPSCMFRCAFCARVTGARYGMEESRAGIDVMLGVVGEADPIDPSTFYVAGGLEPLTNPRLGELAAALADHGFDAPCYTNAYLLNERTFDRQPGLWRFRTWRVSLYGVDEAEYASTTSRAGSFARVDANLRWFLEERERRQVDAKLGLNYVILPGHVDAVRRVVEYIADLNATTPDRPVEYLTLREDFNSSHGDSLRVSDRDALRRSLDDLHEFAAVHLPDLDIDLGYALHQLRHGVHHQLPAIEAIDLPAGGYPQASVVIDPRGDVFTYREAGFPDLPGADRALVGRLEGRHGMTSVVAEHVGADTVLERSPGDERFLDAFDQVVAARLKQIRTDLAAGWGDLRGTLR